MNCAYGFVARGRVEMLYVPPKNSVRQAAAAKPPDAVPSAGRFRTDGGTAKP